MKEKLIDCWTELNQLRYEVANEYLFPIMRDMIRIQLVLSIRYGYRVPINLPVGF